MGDKENIIKSMKPIEKILSMGFMLILISTVVSAVVGATAVYQTYMQLLFLPSVFSCWVCFWGKTGLDLLIKLSDKYHRIALLCSEKDAVRCHRKYVADQLKIDVIHL